MGAITKEGSSWQCPDGYAGPDQCSGGQCDGNDVREGSPENGDCCDMCTHKCWVNDHYEVCTLHGCSSGSCCNCWRYTGASLTSELGSAISNVGNGTANSDGQERRLSLSRRGKQASFFV